MTARLVVCLLVGSCLPTWPDDSRPPDQIAREIEQVTLWRTKLEESRMLTDREKWEQLSLGLRNMGHRRSFPGHSSQVAKTYEDLQKALLAIPGHARWYAEEIERERKTVEDLPPQKGPRVSYDRNRLRHLTTLSHLPSPETVEVLGHYLSDDRDEVLLPSDDPAHQHMELGVAGNSSGAAAALTYLGLKEAPVPPSRYQNYGASREEIALWKDWWSEVKSGRRAFSFVGGDTEYRFRDDGTVETTTLVTPTDDPAPPAELQKSRSDRPEPATTGAANEPTASFPLLWVILGSSLLVGSVALILRKPSVPST